MLYRPYLEGRRKKIIMAYRTGYNLILLESRIEPKTVYTQHRYSLVRKFQLKQNNVRQSRNIPITGTQDSFMEN
jgi:DNA-binding SARP family transcriptional activator